MWKEMLKDARLILVSILFLIIFYFVFKAGWEIGYEKAMDEYNRTLVREKAIFI